MEDSEVMAFHRMIFVSVLSFQYHPKNDVSPDMDDLIIARSLAIADRALVLYSDHLSR